MRILTALLAATLPLATNGLVQLLPAGQFAARDGRPGAGKKWKITDAQGATLAASLNAITAQTPVVIDYEHQTLHAPANGQPAPAAGWIKRAEWRAGQGLFADVEWTAAAKAAIQAGEYRYISPVITYSADGTVQGVAMAALTNYPALLGMDAALAHLSALTITPTETPAMNPLLLALLTAMCLPATTLEVDALSAVSALKAEFERLKAKADAALQAPLPAALTAALGLAAGADETAALAALTKLKAGTGIDTATLTLITDLQGQLAALRTQVNADTLTTTVDGAIKLGKFAPASRAALLALGARDMAALTAIVEASPAIPGLAGQSAAAGAAAADAGASTAALTGQQADIAAKLGLDPKAYAAQIRAAATA